MTNYDRLEYHRDNNTLNYFYNRFNNSETINQLIPISKLYESCEKIYESVKHVVEYGIPEGFDFYNKTATNVFFLLEQAGLGIFYENFNNMFKPRNPRYNTIDNTVLTSYNLYNATSRPTNAFNSVNFAAIPKGRDYRSCFRPKGDYFVELDFDGYHLRLLCDQIDYKLTSDSAHEQLAKTYFEKDTITDEEYNKPSKLTFTQFMEKYPKDGLSLKSLRRLMTISRICGKDTKMTERSWRLLVENHLQEN